jgi:hypothetical protein
MDKVDFTFKNGHTRVMAKRQAEILGKLGHGTYLTRDMLAARPIAAAPVVSQPVAIVSQASTEVDEFDAMDKEQLHAIAKERGVKVHHMAGADKVRAALRGDAK